MRSIPRPAKTIVRLRLGMMKPTSDVGEAIAPFSPVGWSAAVARENETPDYFFGGEAIPGERPVEKETIFRIASISKVFGAAAALRLVSRGRLFLDADIQETLGFSAGRPITLRQLLTHTASVSDAVYDTVIFSPDTMPLDQLLPKSFHSFAPGTRFSYSNLGAGVVGMMVEAASGMLFDDFIRQEFFIPLGMDASFHPQRIQAKDRMAHCYGIPGGKLMYDATALAKAPLDEKANPRTHYNVPAGKLMISAPDLLRVFRRLPITDPDLFTLQSHIGTVYCDAGRGLGIAHVAPGVFDKAQSFWGHQGCAYGAVCEAWIGQTGATTAVLLTNGARLNPIGPVYQVGQSGIAALLAHAKKERCAQ